jgi:peptidoglycan hydrolase-like protein with peptidoglycan-binding domain
MKIVVSEKKPPVAPEPFSHIFTVDILFKTRNDEVKYLQDALKLFNCFPLNVQSTGYFGEITKQSVLNFQIL